MSKISFLISAMAKIGLIGFGGGNALVPVIERELVESSKILPQEEFDKEVVVANITPGALPIEIASGAGRVIAGIPGMILSAVAMAFPGALFTLVLLALFTTAAASMMTQVRFASVGVTMLIVVLLTSYTAQAIRSKPEKSRERIVSICLVVVVFLLTCGKKLFKLFGLDAGGVLALSTLDVLGVVFFAIFFTRGKFLATKASRIRTGIAGVISLVYLLSTNSFGPFSAVDIQIPLRVLMIALGAWGFIQSFRDEHGPIAPFPAKQMAKEVAAWACFVIVLSIPALILCPEALLFAGRAGLSVLMSFGGGDAYLVFGQGMFVDTGMITDDQYYAHVVMVSNAMPGSIIAKVLTGVGFFIGMNYGAVAGVCVAISGFACGVGISGMTFLIVYYIYERFEPLSVFRAIKRYIRPVIGGLLLTIAITMFSLNMNVADSFSLNPIFMVVFSLVLFAVLYWAGNIRRLPLAALILAAILVSLVACNLVYAIM